MIEIKNLTKRFQDFTALENVTCTIGSGCIYGMVGSNGAGKSTLLKIIMGELTPDSGEVIISRGKTIGYLAQHQDIHSEATIYEEMMKVRNLGRKSLEEVIGKLEAMGLSLADEENN